MADIVLFAALNIFLSSQIAALLGARMPDNGQVFTCTRTFRHHRKDTSTLCFTPSGELVTGSYDTKVKMRTLSKLDGLT